MPSVFILFYTDLVVSRTLVFVQTINIYIHMYFVILLFPPRVLYIYTYVNLNIINSDGKYVMCALSFSTEKKRGEDE